MDNYCSNCDRPVAESIQCPHCRCYCVSPMPCEHVLKVVKVMREQGVVATSGDYAASNGRIECAKCGKFADAQG